MPDRNQNLVGKHFGHLDVIAKSEKRGKHGEYYWICRCDCGRKTLATTGALNSGEKRSCGHTQRLNLESGGQHHQSMLGNKPPKTNKTGYRNISMLRQGKRLYYRVSVQYDHKVHQKVTYSLKEALAIREELREKWWPNYKK